MSVGRITQQAFDSAVKQASTAQTGEVLNSLYDIQDLVRNSDAFGPLYEDAVNESALVFGAGIQVGILLAGKGY